jgi:hypothetical protein
MKSGYFSEIFKSNVVCSSAKGLKRFESYRLKWSAHFSYALIDPVILKAPSYSK